jgi:inhibitor of KinA
MSSRLPFRIFPLGDSAVTIEFGNTISADINDKAIALSEYFEANPFPGFVESVPAFVSTTIYFDLIRVKRTFPSYATAFDAVADQISRTVDSLPDKGEIAPRRITIPVDFSGSAGLDLDELTEKTGLTREEFLAIFLSREYRVYMLGFLPGFTYMGEVDERIASPRKQTPRTEVPKGSVGIAGSQTGIYSLASPGGWQIIGRTDVEMFTPDAASPTLLRPGDLVTFEPAE